MPFLPLPFPVAEAEMEEEAFPRRRRRRGRRRAAVFRRHHRLPEKKGPTFFFRKKKALRKGSFVKNLFPLLQALRNAITLLYFRVFFFILLDRYCAVIVHVWYCVHVWYNYGRIHPKKYTNFNVKTYFRCSCFLEF